MNCTSVLRRLSVLILTVSLCLSASTAHAAGYRVESRFEDVIPGHWYYSAIEYVVENGYFNGIDEKHFSPDMPMTRAMFVTVLGRMAGVEGTAAEAVHSVFVDVEPDSYFNEYVAWAAENGITMGISDTLFGYAEGVTREQVSLFLYRYAKLIGLDTSIRQTAAPNLLITEVNPSPWALTAVVWAANHGIMNGVGNDLNPKAVLTRAQCAQIMMNFSKFASK